MGVVLPRPRIEILKLRSSNRGEDLRFQFFFFFLFFRQGHGKFEENRIQGGLGSYSINITPLSICQWNNLVIRLAIS